MESESRTRDAPHDTTSASHPSQLEGADVSPGMAVLTLWHPGEEEYGLVYTAAQEFARNRNASPSQLYSIFIDLVDSLFSRHFMTTHSAPPLLPQPLLDCLVCCRDPAIFYRDQHKHSTAIRFLMNDLFRVVTEVNGVGDSTDKRLLDSVTETLDERGDSDTRADDEVHLIQYTTSFYQALETVWKMHESKLEKALWSPMPWSRWSSTADYRNRALLGDSISVALDDIKPSARDDLFYFPDMLWLGGRHDGYCRAQKLSAYVWIRLRTARSATEHLPLWQSALTFGTLEALFGFRIPESALLTRRPDGSCILTSAKVSRLVWFWLFGRASVTHPSAVCRWIEDARRELKGAKLAIREQAQNEKAEIPGARRLTQDELETIFCSLATLTEALESLCDATVAASCERVDLPSFSDALPASDTKYREMMVTKGWCPYLSHSCQMSALCALAYATTLSPPLIAGSAKDHTACTRECCEAYTLSLATYETEHASDCPGSPCTLLIPSRDRISELLSSGKIPAMLYDGRNLTVRDAEDGPFVAISHVWADGLGSTAEVGLLTCQVARIASLARLLVPDGAFWIDSLCVSDSKALRYRAIDLMAATYRRAENVLVLDATIRQLSIKTPPKELILRLALSPWMHRVWTLPEGLLAREVYFECVDGLVSIAHLKDLLASCKEVVPSSALGPIYRDPFMHLYVSPSLLSLLERPNIEGAYSFTDIVKLLRNRTASNAEDETLAIAGLLGIDAQKLLEVEGADERMRVLYLEVKNIPAAIVFQPGPKLECSGFQWAPRTLTRLDMEHDHMGMAECTPHGLVTEQTFTIVSFPEPVAFSRPDRDTHLVINWPGKGTAYLVSTLMEAAGQGAVLANGIIVHPGPVDGLEALSSESPPPYVLAVAVNIRSSDSAQTQAVACDVALDAASVVCEALLHVPVSAVRTQVKPESFTPEWRERGMIMVEGRFTSARIVLT
ncbi:hypothetical protein C8Q74DRAFT_913042 [Fomes fomentarius]|nr:hypothetical protein C8Q74DRAFT_913042 [Fomes fomentarius]